MMQPRRATLVLTLVAASLATPAAADASSSFAASFQLGFPTTRPGASTGLSTLMTWKDPGAPGAVPKVIKRIDLGFPRGTVLDTGGLKTCDATDEQIVAGGPTTCPAASRLGGGATDAVTGDGGTSFTTVVTLFNAPGQIIVVVTLNGTLITEFRDIVKRDAIVVRPKLPAGVALKRLALKVDPHVLKKTAYLRTPTTCPKSGRWTTTARFAYTDGSTQRLSSTSRCRGA